MTNQHPQALELAEVVEQIEGEPDVLMQLLQLGRLTLELYREGFTGPVTLHFRAGLIRKARG